MAKYISAVEAAEKAATALKIPLAALVDVFAETPAADVAPVRRGHWIEDGDCQICSECGEEHCWDEYRAAYCDSCGAKMDGKGGDA